MKKIFQIILTSYCLLIIEGSQAICEQKALTINDVIQYALENNLSLKVKRISKDIQKDRLDASETIFDSTITSNIAIARQDAKTDQQVFRSNLEKIDVSVSKLIKNGDIFIVSLKSNRQETKPFLPLAPTTSREFTHNASMTYIKPLMKEKGESIIATEIQVEKNNLHYEKLLFKQYMIETIATAQTYYWELYKSKEQLRAQLKSLELAQEFLKTTQEKVDMGLLANSEVLQAKAEVAARDEAVLISDNSVKNNEDRLIQYIFGKIEWMDYVKLVEKPIFEKLKIMSIDAEIQKALTHRIDYQLSQITLKNAELNCAYYQNQTLPKIDLNATLSIDGDGKTNNIAFDRFFSGESYTAQLGISVEYPWKLRQDKANYQKAKHEKQQAELSIGTIKQQIILDVRKALRDVLSLEKRYESTQVAKELADEKLSMEVDRFKSGYSTSYNVLQFQRDLTDAMVKNINASVDYQIARVNFNMATGISLEVHNIKEE